MRKLLIKNSFSGIVLLLISTILVFFSVSIFNLKLGSELYGIFATITLIGNLNIFTNLGINSTLIIFISERGKSKESDHNIIVSFILLASIIIPLSIFLLIFNRFIILEVLNIPSQFFNSVQYLYLFLVISNCIIFIGQTFSAILDSMQKMYFTNIFQLIYNSLYNLLIIFSIILSNDLSYTGLSILFSSILWFSLVSYKSIHFWGKLDFSNLKETFFCILKKQLSLGFKLYVSGLFFFFYEPLTKILISHFLGVKEVGFFDIALKIRNQFWGLINKATQPLFPFISQIKDLQILHKIINDLEQKIFYLIIPIIISTIFCTNYLIGLWIGGDNIALISNTTSLIVIGYLLFSATMIPQYYYLMSKGHAVKTIYIQAVNTFSNLIFILILFKSMGYYAFVISYILAIVFSFMLMLYYQKKLLNSLIFDSINQTLKLGAVIVILFSICYALNYLPLNDFLKLFLIPIVCVISSIFLYRFLKVITKEEIEIYLGVNNKLSSIVVKLICS